MKEFYIISKKFRFNNLYLFLKVCVDQYRSTTSARQRTKDKFVFRVFLTDSIPSMDKHFYHASQHCSSCCSVLYIDTLFFFFFFFRKANFLLNFLPPPPLPFLYLIFLCREMIGVNSPSTGLRSSAAEEMAEEQPLLLLALKILMRALYRSRHPRARAHPP